VRIGVAAGGVDERTVKAFLLGRRTTHALVAQSIRRAMAELGFALPANDQHTGDAA